MRGHFVSRHYGYVSSIGSRLKRGLNVQITVVPGLHEPHMGGPSSVSFCCCRSYFIRFAAMLDLRRDHVSFRADDHDVRAGRPRRCLAGYGVEMRHDLHGAQEPRVRPACAVLVGATAGCHRHPRKVSDRKAGKIRGCRASTCTLSSCGVLEVLLELYPNCVLHGLRCCGQYLSSRNICFPFGGGGHIWVPTFCLNTFRFWPDPHRSFPSPTPTGHVMHSSNGTVCSRIKLSLMFDTYVASTLSALRRFCFEPLPSVSGPLFTTKLGPLTEAST